MRKIRIALCLLPFIGCNNPPGLTANEVALEYCKCLDENRSLAPRAAHRYCEGQAEKKSRLLHLYIHSRDRQGRFYPASTADSITAFVASFLKVIDDCQPSLDFANQAGFTDRSKDIEQAIDDGQLANDLFADSIQFGIGGKRWMARNGVEKAAGWKQVRDLFYRKDYIVLQRNRPAIQTGSVYEIKTHCRLFLVEMDGEGRIFILHEQQLDLPDGAPPCNEP